MSSLDIRLSAAVGLAGARPRNAEALGFGPPEVLGLAGMADVTGAAAFFGRGEEGSGCLPSRQ